MMNKIKQLHFKEILLFDGIDQDMQSSNALKEFIYYLKFVGKKGMINFALSSSSENIHQHLSIKDNYILDSVPKSLIKDREDNFSARMTDLTNEHLRELVFETHCIERKVKDISSQERKLVSIVKALLSDSEFIFLDKPDSEQPIEIVKKIKSAILFEVESCNRKVFLNSKKREIWLDISTDIVSRNQNNEFIKTTNKLNQSEKVSRELSLIKQAS